MKTNIGALSLFANANIGWMFYRHYYHGLTDKAWATTDDEIRGELFHKTWQRHIEKDNDDEIVYGYNDFFITLKFGDYKNTLGKIEERFYTSAKNSAHLITTYPGLITGVGTEHETGELGEFKLGFAFDHTTGMPYIPASGVKGLLRSAFTKYAGFTLGELSEKGKDWDLQKLAEEIFDGKRGDKELGIYQRDIFFDAYISASTHTDNFFMGNDYITHHPTQFTDPNPLQFLKVLPNVTFRFNFDLKDGSQLSAADKETLFKKILTTIGIGAKTNVGYGQLDYLPEEKEKIKVADEKMRKAIEEEGKIRAKTSLSAPAEYDAVVVSLEDGKLKVNIIGYDIELEKKKVRTYHEKGQILKIKLTGLNPIIFNII